MIRQQRAVAGSRMIEVPRPPLRPFLGAVDPSQHLSGPLVDGAAVHVDVHGHRRLGAGRTGALTQRAGHHARPPGGHRLRKRVGAGAGVTVSLTTSRMWWEVLLDHEQPAGDDTASHSEWRHPHQQVLARSLGTDGVEHLESVSRAAPPPTRHTRRPSRARTSYFPGRTALRLRAPRFRPSGRDGRSTSRAFSSGADVPLRSASVPVIPDRRGLSAPRGEPPRADPSRAAQDRVDTANLFMEAHSYAVVSPCNRQRRWRRHTCRSRRGCRSRS